MGSNPILIITADDYGYGRAYDDGILEAARAGAIDATSALVDRDEFDPAPLLETGIEIGLHLELEAGGATEGEVEADTAGSRDPICHVDLARAGPRERAVAGEQLEAQLARFEAIFGRAPAFLDGHHHAQGRPGLASLVARVARRRQMPVRSVDARHRRLLRCQGVPTPDRLIGRLRPDEPALPDELRGPLPPGVTEWMVHPGHPDPDLGSSYDGARQEDLELVLSFTPPPGARRATHGEALD